MNSEIRYIDRVTGREEIEDVYGAGAIQLVYGDSLASKLIGRPLLYLLARTAPAARLYGWLKKRRASAKEIRPFVEQYEVDSSEFAKPIEEMSSFNDFFTRELKEECRPLAPGGERAIIPADGRYLVYPKISEADSFIVKGQTLDLRKLLQNDELYEKYANGTLVMARLCPTDYHRFHFPCECTLGKTQFINGWLYSVNPVALKSNVNRLCENKRCYCELTDTWFGDILYMEIGATNVGSIHQTRVSGLRYEKGAEKGYFSFGGSALILLFEPGKIQLDDDLVEASSKGMEMRCLMGQSLGVIAPTSE